MTTRPLKKKSLLLSIMLALFSSLALSISLDPLVDASQIEGSGSADRFLNSWERIIFSIEGFDLSHLLLFVFLAMVIYHYIHKIFLDKRTMLVTAIVSSLLTFFTITGIACISTYRYGVFFSGDLRVIKLVFLSFAYFLSGRRPVPRGGGNADSSGHGRRPGRDGGACAFRDGREAGELRGHQRGGPADGRRHRGRPAYRG